jgi:ribosomal protein L3 glutamine methyltransferase
MASAAGTEVLQTVRDLVRWGASEFNRAGLYFGHGTDNALDESFHLVLHALRLPSDLPTVYLEACVTKPERAAALKLLRARVRSRKPAAYLIGEMPFAGLSFHVDERVLIPRSPIGELIGKRFEPWLATEPLTILDLCAGSGCIGIACAMVFPEARVDLAERNVAALEVCRQNIERHRCGERVHMIRSDVFGGLKGRRYDLIVANPPYVPSAEFKSLPAEFRHEPRVALEAGADGMDVVARILAEAPDHLRDDGTLICEVGGSVAEFNARWPKLPVTWIEFEHGGDGVFLISRADLRAASS